MSRPSFIQIPISFVRNTSLSRVARLLYPLLQSYANHTPQNGMYVGAHPGLQRLCRDLHCTHRTIRKGLAELRKARLVTWKCPRTNHYTLKALPLDRWIQIPKAMLRGSLRVGPKLTYLAINTFDVWGTTGDGARPRRPQLQEILGCSESGLRGWLNILVEADLLRIEGDGQYVLCEYAQVFEWSKDGSTLEQLSATTADFPRALGHDGRSSGHDGRSPGHDGRPPGHDGSLNGPHTYSHPIHSQLPRINNQESDTKMADSKKTGISPAKRF